MFDYSVYNDEELIREYRQTKNQQIMAILFTRYADIGFRTAMRFVRNQADAEDILQTTYIHFLQNLDLFREGTTIRPWLMKMIVNTCKNKLIEEKRRQKRHDKVASERLVKHDSETQKSELVNENNELKEVLRKNVDLLPEKYRSPIWLVLFEEVSYSEVATVLELPEKTIRTQVARGLEKLRQALSSYGSVLSISAISELIKETTLEKAPSSINQLINSPEIYQIASNSAKKNTLNQGHSSFYSFKVVTIIGVTTIMAIFSFINVRNTNEWKALTDGSKQISQESKEKTPMHLSIDFNQKSDVDPYLFLGNYNYLATGGLGNSGSIEISKKLILRLPVKNAQLPLKVTYRMNLVNRDKISGYSFMTWDQWEKMSVIHELSKAYLVESKIGDYLFKKDEDWIQTVIWITKDSIDIWSSGRRINLYLFDQKGNNNYIYLYLIDEFKIDNFLIESVDKSIVPDISKFLKINEEVYRNSKEKITIIKEYFPEIKDDKIIPRHHKFNSQTEAEVINEIKNMVNE